MSDLVIPHFYTLIFDALILLLNHTDWSYFMQFGIR